MTTPLDSARQLAAAIMATRPPSPNRNGSAMLWHQVMFWRQLAGRILALALHVEAQRRGSVEAVDLVALRDQLRDPEAVRARLADHLGQDQAADLADVSEVNWITACFTAADALDAAAAKRPPEAPQ